MQPLAELVSEKKPPSEHPTHLLHLKHKPAICHFSVHYSEVFLYSLRGLFTYNIIILFIIYNWLEPAPIQISSVWLFSRSFPWHTEA